MKLWQSLIMSSSHSHGWHGSYCMQISMLHILLSAFLKFYNILMTITIIS